MPVRRLALLLAFLRSESVAGLALIGAALLALLWSNSPQAAGYFRLLTVPVGVHVGGESFELPVDGWVNDGLMALFFLTVALEIRRELTEGQLASLQKAAAPGIAAFGGMVVPALIYAALNHADPATLRGWAVPVATDIAFALAALRVLGRRVPVGLKVFLTALAIIDDLGAILVIALFYTSRIDVPAALAACAVWAALFGFNRLGVRALSVYVLGGVLLWACVLRSGVHPTLAGVALAFVVPAQEKPGDMLGSPAHRLEQALGGWVTWLVLPLFGLANAGLRFGGISLDDLVHPVMLGTVLGLVVGKQAGVFGATVLAVRTGLARMPAGLSRIQLYGGSLLCGIGFTMSLFIGDLSFRGTPFHPEVKLAVFLGSLISAALGLGVLALASGRRATARHRVRE
jgi:Na+:H+ antiporter, NhaA family